METRLRTVEEEVKVRMSISPSLRALRASGGESPGTTAR
jgi:hypothetical protein